MTTIGLFPLRIVLFPGSHYPLHIFEERYKILIRESLASHAEFGINLVEDGNMYSVGCRARVQRVINEYEDGRMDIIVAGTDRYAIVRSHANARPYLTAEIVAYDDVDGQPTPEVLEKTVSDYNRIVEVVFGEAEQPLDPTDCVSGGCAFHMAQKSGLDLVVRQQLLEMRSETERLRLLAAYYEQVLPRIRKAETLQALVRNDGYVRPDADHPTGTGSIGA